MIKLLVAYTAFLVVLLMLNKVMFLQIEKKISRLYLQFLEKHPQPSRSIFESNMYISDVVRYIGEHLNELENLFYKTLCCYCLDFWSCYSTLKLQSNHPKCLVLLNKRVRCQWKDIQRVDWWWPMPHTNKDIRRTTTTSDSSETKKSGEIAWMPSP